MFLGNGQGSRSGTSSGHSHPDEGAGGGLGGWRAADQAPKNKNKPSEKFKNIQIV